MSTLIASIGNQSNSVQPQRFDNPLPLLPGYTFQDLNAPTSYKKKQIFAFRNGVPQPSDYKPPAAELQLKQQRTDASAIQNAHPDWVSLDKKVLRFYAYFKEGVHEQRNESVRIRRCSIYFYLEDDTMQVTEPKQENSGIVQGNFVKRHKIPKDNKQSEFFSIDDFDIGNDISVYGKTFHIVDCDAFTRYFYSQLGRSLRPLEDFPDDSYTQIRSKAMQSVQARKARDVEHVEFKRYSEFAAGGRINLPTATERENAKKFHHSDRKVLRFHCVWDDSKSLSGDARHFTLLYFLSDDTCKVIELSPANSGRDPFPVFIKRQRIPKTASPAADQNLETLTTRQQEFIIAADLMVGRTIDLFGRPFLLHDCDDFTKQYYHDTFGIIDFTPFEYQQQQDNNKPTQQSKSVLQPPPHTGFGSEEDSLASWKYLVLKPPKKDVKKLMTLDKKVLRFSGYMEAEPLRRVILIYYLADDTIGIFEQSARNTGYVGGRFLQRQRVKKPIDKPDKASGYTGLWSASSTNSSNGANATANGNNRNKTVANNGTTNGNGANEYYQANDFAVGVTVDINGHKIALDGTDEATVAFMEGRPKEFSVSDAQLLFAKLRSSLATRYSKVTDAFRALDRDHNGLITVEEFAQACTELNLQITPHEVMTLMRHLDEDRDGVISLNEFVKRIQPPDHCGELDTQYRENTVRKLADPKDLTFARGSASCDALTQRVVNTFKDKLESVRSTFVDQFRLMADRSFDTRIGEAEFRKTVVDTLQMNLTDEWLTALMRWFFPSPGTRLTMQEFAAKLDVSTFVKKY